MIDFKFTRIFTKSQYQPYVTKCNVKLQNVVKNASFVINRF